MVDLAAQEHEVEGGARAARPRIVLRHEGAEAAGANPDVDVRRTRLVRRRLVALEPVAAAAAGEDGGAVGVVVLPLWVGEPELDPGARDCATRPRGKHTAREDVPGAHFRSDRSSGLVERPERVR